MPDERFNEKVEDINTLYRQAPVLTEQGQPGTLWVPSTDELSGVQALERKYPSLPLTPGKVEHQECEYIRPGTQCFIVSLEVATGRVLEPTCSPTRTEEDFAAHSKRTVVSAQQPHSGTSLSIRRASTSISRNSWSATWRMSPTLPPTWA